MAKKVQTQTQKQYHVKYVVDTSPRIKSFYKKEDMELWVEAFKEATDHTGSVSWIDLIFDGKILEDNL